MPQPPRFLRYACAATFVAALGACAPATPSGASPSPGAAAPAVSSGFGKENRVVDKNAVNGTTVFVAMRAPKILDPGKGPMKISLDDAEVVLTTESDNQTFREITYIIKHEDDPSYRLQLNSGEDLNDFIIKVSFKRLYRGHYTVEAFPDDDLEPVDTGRFEVIDEGL